MASKKGTQKKRKGRIVEGKARMVATSKLTAKGSKVGGSKLVRSEVVQVRLDPKLRFAVELASRRQRRTVSSFIEWAVDQAVKQEILFSEGCASLTVYEAAERVWDVDESERFVNLANHYPHLLTHEEEVLWKLTKEQAFRWLSPESLASDEKGWVKKLTALDFIRLRAFWEDLKKVARGEMSEEDLTLLEHTSSHLPSDFLPGGK